MRKMYQTSFVIHFLTPHMYWYYELYLLLHNYNDSQSYYMKCSFQIISPRLFQFLFDKSYIGLFQWEKCTKLPLNFVPLLVLKVIPYWSPYHVYLKYVSLSTSVFIPWYSEMKNIYVFICATGVFIPLRCLWYDYYYG